MKEILFVSSIPPRECGIATYTQDLMRAIEEKFGGSFSLRVCALENQENPRPYGEEVKFVLHTSDHSSYIKTAERINADKNIRAVFIQHEFGLFSGEYGKDLLYFLYGLHKPIITAFHTVLPEPDAWRREIVNAIASVSDAVVVMTQRSAAILKEEYALQPEKITVIHHGTHLVPCADKEEIKKKYGLENNYVLSTFGLLSSGKCIETALDALPAIAGKFPEVMYLVIGRTHPEVVKHEGERYRRLLEEKIENLGIKDNVRFVNRYLSLAELLEYLQLTDIYLFTSKDPNQAVSGTFSYAMGCGCPVISTPIPHAQEMLAGDAGVIVDFKNPAQLAAAAIDLLGHPEKRKTMSLNALHRIRPTAWQNSALAHAELFRKVIRLNDPLRYSFPAISLAHLQRLTTHCGIIQFADICRPDIASGYTLDDNARALIAATRHFELSRSEEDTRLLDIYLNFIKYSQQADGSFLNYVDEEGRFHVKNHYVNLQDSMGRAVWALGEFLSLSHLFHPYFSTRAEIVMRKALETVRRFDSPRAMAFAIKGLYHYNRSRNEEDIKELLLDLAQRLLDKYNHVADGEWKWFEDYLTYANSILSEALLYAYLVSGREAFRLAAISSFNFLLSQIFIDGKIRVISNRGWHKKGEERRHFGEQPIDVAYTILSLDLFYEMTGNEDYRRKMDAAFTWFQGNNHLKQIIYNPATGGCNDGLEEHNVNLNQGAESTVCYLLARLTIEKYYAEAEEKFMVETARSESMKPEDAGNIFAGR